MVKTIEGLNAKGILRIFNARTKELLYIKQNLVVNTGLAYIVDRMKTVPPDPINWIEVGTGTTLVDPTDTTLETPLLRKEVVDMDTIENTLTVNTLFENYEAVDNWKELGMFNAITGGVMFNRINIDFNKTSDDAVIVEFTVIITRT